MTSEIISKGGLRTEAKHLASGSIVVTDAPLDNKGRGQAFSPTDLAATALGSCMLTIMDIAAQNNSLSVEGAKAKIKKVMAANPRRISEIHVEIDMPKISYSKEAKEILENAAITCPVALGLNPDIKQVVRFNWQ